MAIRVRDARPDDRATVADFNARLALETEDKTLDPVVLDRGVARALADPDRLRYWMAEDSETGEVVGQVAITREWSDWRDGWIWWFQSVYVLDHARGSGVFRTLHRHVRELARATPGVIGLRLYVEVENDRAIKTYRSLGMAPGGYDVYEDLWIGQGLPHDPSELV
jgi:GNAT superfamily N-acetyltransferase